MFGNVESISALADKQITIKYANGLYEIGIPEEFLKLPEEDLAYIITKLATALGVKEIIKIF